jgi:hypothetical protein
MFRGVRGDSVRLPYKAIAKPGVRILRETVTAIDPEAKRVDTHTGVHEADFLVVALGSDYDLDATPGLAEVGTEFYSVAGAERLAEILPASPPATPRPAGHCARPGSQRRDPRRRERAPLRPLPRRAQAPRH